MRARIHEAQLEARRIRDEVEANIDRILAFLAENPESSSSSDSE